MTTALQKAVPTWILIVSGIFALMELMVSVSLCVAPETVVETVDLSAKGVDYIIEMWAARQFALGFIFAWATIKRSASMLTLSYIFFLVMFLGDLAIGLKQQETPMIASAVVMSLLSALMLYMINRK